MFGAGPNTIRLALKLTDQFAICCQCCKVDIGAAIYLDDRRLSRLSIYH